MEVVGVGFKKLNYDGLSVGWGEGFTPCLTDRWQFISKEVSRSEHPPRLDNVLDGIIISSLSFSFVAVMQTLFLVNCFLTFLHDLYFFRRRQWHPTPVLLPRKSYGRRSMGSLRVRHDWATSLTHWWRKWQPTPVFLPGESQGRGSLVGYRIWGRKELDMTEVT